MAETPNRDWIKVEFWGVPAEGTDFMTMDPAETANAVGNALGLEYIDGLVVTEPARRSPGVEHKPLRYYRFGHPVARNG